MSEAAETTVDDVRDWWATGVSEIAPNLINFRGYPIQDLIGHVSFVDTIWLLVRGDLPTPGQSKLLEAALVSSADHGPQAPSIAIARMSATCGIGLNNAMASGINALGDVHGGAGQACVALLWDMKQRIDAGTNIDDAASQVVQEHKTRRAYVPGFGHRFHTVDPRRDPLLNLLDDAVEAGEISGDYVACVRALEQALGRRSSHATRLPMNIDGATATVYAELGVPPELARGLFVLSRSVGVLAHAWEEKQSGRRIKGPIPPPLTAPYTGQAERTL
ncbi:citryl-CoA lyase [Paramicrobacterium chengjingii]|uniref:citryl-CoA lyase n=1 Tax=Paramicrobacterium chengjingii TaxID=2769067 RepID=UPI001421E20F|nr:citryl-CoA lyase [Microbacterium chengjingii]